MTDTDTPVELIPTRLVRTTTMCAAAECSRVTLWKWSRAGIIPMPVRLAHNSIRWPLEEVLAALRRRQERVGQQTATV